MVEMFFAVLFCAAVNRCGSGDVRLLYNSIGQRTYETNQESGMRDWIFSGTIAAGCL